ncbi:MAG: LacI family DNA-binding transcriptional regulator [Mycobacteriales bacterium]
MDKVTLKTIADRVGVSRMTVSNAFARPDQLSDAMRERVLAVADELGYTGPDPAARALARGATGAVGVLLTDSLGIAFADVFATAFLAAVADALADHGLALTLLTPPRTAGVIPSRDVALDGAIVYACGPLSEDVGWLKRRRLPAVFVDQQPVAGGAHANVDDHGGARAAAQHLLDLGHRRIAILTVGSGVLTGVVADPWGQTITYSAEQRLAGWFEALSAAGVVPTVAVEPFRPDQAAYDGARQLLELTDRPTALLCYSDAFAASAMRAAAELGLRVPDDVSVVGYDDSAVAVAVRPTLTTVRQDVNAKARAAVHALTSLIAAGPGVSSGNAEHVLLPTQLIVRDSTAPPKAPRVARRNP